MTSEVWKTVGIVDNENMMVPHVLQQKYMRISQKFGWNPRDEHRLVPISDLHGVDE